MFGEYFPGAKSLEDAIPLARHFAEVMQSDIMKLRKRRVVLKRIKGTNQYQLQQGNHRAAINLYLGKTEVPALIHRWRREITPIQFLLNSLRWEQGERVLYQPIPFPEINCNWELARNCQDRYAMMKTFLDSQKILDGTFLDIGSYYGWFVSKFNDSGFDSYGVEKDNIPYEIGKIAFPNVQGKIWINDGLRFLEKSSQTFRVISCLSVLHHMVSGREIGSALDFLREIDRCTEDVFFFEMGQETETWFKKSLEGWSVDYIENWVLNNTTFNKSIRLGSDQDSIGQFFGNYGRTIFAFTR